MSITQAQSESFGRTPDGRPAALYTLVNDRLRARITDFGGRLTSLEVAQDDGNRRQTVLGFDDVADYVKAGKPFGALLGRTSNRIASGCFLLDGKRYELTRNEGANTLHGGGTFGNVFWEVENADGTRLVLKHISADGDQGFPGELEVRATWRLEGATLWLEFEARTDAPGPLSLSAHPYFNLGEAVDVLDHEFTIAADTFLPTDGEQIPTGERRSVAGTPFDFRDPTTAAARIRTPDSQLIHGKGYDHYYILGAGDPEAPQFAAQARDAATGCTLEIHTTQPGLQFYTGNNLNGTIAGRSGLYRQSAAFAFEPQGFPNAPNQRDFPSAVLRPGEVYRHAIGYRLSFS
ncbi:MAG TPA: aldose epimerase family protein [Gammaproteobacteria bacterium]|nr:aldose epimerase family protein [Gammaproteobacteria bacterium]